MLMPVALPTPSVTATTWPSVVRLSPEPEVANVREVAPASPAFAVPKKAAIKSSSCFLLAAATADIT